MFFHVCMCVCVRGRGYCESNFLHFVASILLLLVYTMSVSFPKFFDYVIFDFMKLLPLCIRSILKINTFHKNNSNQFYKMYSSVIQPLALSIISHVLDVTVIVFTELYRVLRIARSGCKIE